MKIQGSIVALVTPMNADGSVDLDSMRRLMELADCRRYGRFRYCRNDGRIAYGQCR